MEVTSGDLGGGGEVIVTLRSWVQRLRCDPAWALVVYAHVLLCCRYTHMLGDKQWQYNDWLVAAAGDDLAPLPEWRQKMYQVAGESFL